MTNLALFDIDGTLTRTGWIDSRCFAGALNRVFGIDRVEEDWSAFRHVTDSHILPELVARRRGERPSEEETERFRREFLALLEAGRRAEPRLFGEIPGARKALRRLSREPGWVVGLASGGWRISALFKLGCIGVKGESYPAAFADDDETREGIIRAAHRRARLGEGSVAPGPARRFERVVYVGDGVWDARTCRALGLPLVGIGTGARAERLREEGVGQVLPDFEDFRRFRQALERAREPFGETEGLTARPAPPWPGPSRSAPEASGTTPDRPRP